MGPWWWWAGRFTLSLAFVFLFCPFSLAESLLAHRSAGCKQPRVTTHLTHTWTSFSMSAADRWKTLLTARLTTIGTHLCMIYIPFSDLHACLVLPEMWPWLRVSETVRWWKMASQSCLLIFLIRYSSLFESHFCHYRLEFDTTFDIWEVIWVVL